jgi:hypothetical protein
MKFPVTARKFPVLQNILPVNLPRELREKSPTSSLSYAILDAKLIVFILKKEFILIESKSSFKSK